VDAALQRYARGVIAGLEILNLHAQGGMAEVYRARGRGADGTEYLYAVKRILPEYTRDPEIKKMFIEESRVAACLVHPSVVRVYDLATAENELYIVMEFLEGKDLSEAIEKCDEKKQPLPIWFAIQVCRDVLRALHYVTTEATDKNGRILGLIHRDISPHNIFVCFDGQVKLTDFGVAKVQESNVKTQVGITKGKLGYMSPEQLTGAQLDFRSDLYNVGILLFESITGRQLFAGASTAEFLQAMVRGVVPPIPPALQVPPELEALIRRSLDRDRNKRPATALEFERELGQIADRYGLTAQSAHVAHHMRELYGKPPPPAMMKPATAPQKLRSMMLATIDPRQAEPVAAPQPQPQPQQQVQQQPRQPYARPQTVAGVQGVQRSSPGFDDGATIVRPPTQPRQQAVRPAADLRTPDAFATPPSTDLNTGPMDVSDLRSAVGASRRPATVGRGNARSLEAVPSVPRPAAPSQPTPTPAAAAPAWDTGDLEPNNADKTRIEPSPLRPPAPVTSPSSPQNRPPTISVGGGAPGVKKRVVPLDDKS
jgi:serine/threonine protein kinase